MKNITIILLVVSAIIAGYYLGSKSNATFASPSYIFDSKTFFKNKQSVYVAGTLTGEGVGYPDNTTAISCSKDSMECLITSIQGISKTSCQLGRLDAPQILPITQWNDYLVVASDGNPVDTWSCSKTTINIDLGSEMVEWVQEPINQSSLSCKDYLDNKVYKWTIEDPKWYKDFNASSKK